MINLENKTMLVGIGAQKSGTSWLYEYLKNHPEVFLSPRKEMHVFDHRHVCNADALRNTLLKRVQHLASTQIDRKGNSADLYRRMLMSVEKIAMIDNLDFYIEYFESLVKDQKIFGEITPNYSLLPKEGFLEILSIYESVKFIFIMRDPVSRAWSHINDQLKRTGKEMSDDEKLRCIFEGASGKNNHYFRKGDYCQTINNLESVVSRDNILYLFYENLFTDESIKKICDFLDIEYLSANFSSRVNKGDYSKDISGIDLHAEELYRPIYDFCRERFGDDVPDSWRM